MNREAILRVADYIEGMEHVKSVKPYRRCH